MEVGFTLGNELEIQISNAFCIFDYHGDKFIDTRHVGDVLRFIGCVPTEEEVNEVIKATESYDKPGETYLGKFVPHVSQLIMQKKMHPASSEELLKAFEVLDPENKRFITKSYFGKLMAEEGEPFNEEELQCMWPVAIDPITGTIPYEFYLNQLKHNAKIYTIAENVKEEIAEKEKDSKKKTLM